MFHAHQWVEVERFYQPGVKVEEIERADARALKQLCSGVTTIWFQCNICPKQKFKEVQGQSTRNVTDNQ